MELQLQEHNAKHRIKEFRLSSSLVWLLFPATLCLAITRQSLWIDEGFTAWFASHRTFHSFLSVLIGSRSAPGDPQLIFYLFHVWVWIKVFGSSELSLRAANVPFALIYIATMAWASRRLFWHPNLWILCCLSPFFWFYLNEARPYIALIAFSSVAIVALLAYLIDPLHYRLAAPWFCLCALLFAWGSHILAAFLFPPLALLSANALVENSRHRGAFLRDWGRPALCCFPAFLALGAFYVWVSAYGVNKTEGKPGLVNVAYAMYEFAGFAGLGPPRNEIRQNRSVVSFLPYWEWLVLGFVVLSIVAFSLHRIKISRLGRWLLVSSLLGLTAGFAISAFEQFQVLGRHFAALFPFLLLLVMVYPREAHKTKQMRTFGIALTVLGLVWAISDFRLVFLPAYSKDAYRQAASIVLERAHRDGAKIVWAADPFTARYYGIQVAQDASSRTGPSDGIDLPNRGRAIDPQGWEISQAETFLNSSSTPVILALSKADPFDRKGVWRSLMQQRPALEIARLNAFVIYEWQPTPKDRLGGPLD